MYNLVNIYQKYRTFLNLPLLRDHTNLLFIASTLCDTKKTP